MNTKAEMNQGVADVLERMTVTRPGPSVATRKEVNRHRFRSSAEQGRVELMKLAANSGKDTYIKLLVGHG